MAAAPYPAYATIEPVGDEIKLELQRALDEKTKPLGSLGVLEELAIKVGAIQRTLNPEIRRPTLLIFAGDHGITEDQVSPYPSDVTAQMVQNFLAGGAAANVLARQANMELLVIDAGVRAEIPAHPRLLAAKIGFGTANFRHAPAMTPDACRRSLEQGAAIIEKLADSGANTVALGEMGIGNTSAAACLMSKLTSTPIAQCVGRGAGLSDSGVEHKIRILTMAMNRCEGVAANPLDLLAQYGGYEIAMLCGAVLAAASRHMVVVIDGFIVTAAALVAASMQPQVLDYCVFAHESEEQGHKLLLARLKAKPLLNLRLRLGEGSGAILAVPLLRAATAILNEMATFASAKISGNASLNEPSTMTEMTHDSQVQAGVGAIL